MGKGPEKLGPLSEGQMRAREALKAHQFRKGEQHGNRIGNEAMKAVRLARRYCPDAIMYAYAVLKDPTESTTLRLKATDLILHHGMPRGDTRRYIGEETIGAITLNLVMPKIDDALPAPPTIDGVSLKVDTPTQGEGD